MPESHICRSGGNGGMIAKKKKSNPFMKFCCQDNMGRGEVIGKSIYEASIKWMSVTPESVGMAFWKLACKK